MADPILQISGLSHAFGRNRVLHDLNIEIQRGQFAALVGPSGCGKSTLLRAIVGTHPPQHGRILVHGPDGPRLVEGPGRDRGIVYQRYSLFPHLTAQENVAYGLMVDQTSTSERWLRPSRWRALRRTHLDQAAAFLQQMKLGDALRRYPPEMSGGMCQRVAIAQALIMKPAILLLDEPFGALDEATREELQRVLLTLYAENLAARCRQEPPPHTVVLVTHEINEAIFVSDRVVGLSQYWDWAGAGQGECPGATFVYDQPAPVFAPADPRDFLSFHGQKEDILNTVFEPAHGRCHRDYVDLAAQASGKGPA